MSFTVSSNFPWVVPFDSGTFTLVMEILYNSVGVALIVFTFVKVHLVGELNLAELKLCDAVMFAHLFWGCAILLVEFLL